MERIKGNKLKEIKGGASFWAIAGSIVAALALIAGVMDGYARPTKCR